MVSSIPKWTDEALHEDCPTSLENAAWCDCPPLSLLSFIVQSKKTFNIPISEVGMFATWNKERLIVMYKLELPKKIFAVGTTTGFSPSDFQEMEKSLRIGKDIEAENKTLCQMRFYFQNVMRYS